MGSLSSILVVGSLSSILEVDAPSFILGVDSPSLVLGVDSPPFILGVDSPPFIRGGRLTVRRPRVDSRSNGLGRKSSTPQALLALLPAHPSLQTASLFSPFVAPMPAWLRGDNKRIELTRPNRDGAYQPHRD